MDGLSRNHYLWRRNQKYFHTENPTLCLHFQFFKANTFCRLSSKQKIICKRSTNWWALSEGFCSEATTFDHNAPLWIMTIKCLRSKNLLFVSICCQLQLIFIPLGYSRLNWNKAGKKTHTQHDSSYSKSEFAN